jgi:hypothetical protein
MHGWGTFPSFPLLLIPLPAFPRPISSLTSTPPGLFFFLLFLLLIFAAIGWVVYTRIRASRQGLPPPPWKSYIPFLGKSQSATNYPTPRSSGPLEWIRDQVDKLRNKRTARGAYEETGRGADGTGAGLARGRDDDAWDTRAPGRDEEESYAAAGPGGYYEEAELGLAPKPGVQSSHTPEPYGGAAARTDYVGAERGRSQQRGHGMGEGSLGVNDPFGDQNEASSLRSVSPRPVEGKGHGQGQGSLEVKGDSPTSRRSMFREGL